MAALIDAITSKQNWQSKIFNPEIVKKWKKESGKPKLVSVAVAILKQSLNQELNCYLDPHVTSEELAVTNCQCSCGVCTIDEDEDEINVPIPQNCICVEGQRKRRKEFIEGWLSTRFLDTTTPKRVFSELEAVTPIDYHPGSNGMIRNIVHPSMYCYVKGVTKPKSSDPKSLLQWIPAEIKIGDNNKVKFDSPINNLDTKHKPVYEVIEDILSEMVNDFKALIGQMVTKQKLKPITNFTDWQVIIKLASCELSPEKPTFEGGNWHLEGVQSEKIIATGIYYYEVRNITESLLSFRTTVRFLDLNYAQYAYNYVKVHYGISLVSDPDYKTIIKSNQDVIVKNSSAVGLENKVVLQDYNVDIVAEKGNGNSDSDSGINEGNTEDHKSFELDDFEYGSDKQSEDIIGNSVVPLASFETKEGMIRVFPNLFQHRPEGYSLLDKTKDGVRKTLVVFLVDPNHRILSTKDIEPQQGVVMSHEEALEYRELLMKHRKIEVHGMNSYMNRGYYLCEH